jgi:hypothetical protein
MNRETILTILMGLFLLLLFLVSEAVAVSTSLVGSLSPLANPRTGQTGT